ncbi:MAG: AMP-binding protein [Gammaproteobacteria bacterium]|nr:AMP-binding protein [Gammaproteobacteria bacterium]
MNIICFDSEFTKKDLITDLAKLPEGTRVAIKMSSGPNLAYVLSTCFTNDLVSIPLNPQLSEAKEHEIIEHCQPHIVVYDNEVVSIKPSRNLTLPKDLSFIIYTSGSTGFPKGVMQSKSAVISNAEAVIKLHGFSKDQCHATCLPLYHCNAIMMSLIGSMLANSNLFIQSIPNMNTYLPEIAAVRASTASIVPALLHDLVQYNNEWPNGLRYLITAAHDLKPSLSKKFFDIYGAKLIQGYGLTEAVNFSFVMPLLNEQSFIKEYINNFPPIGIPIEKTDFKIEYAELLIKGPNNMLGYLNNQVANDETLTKDGWLKTGDIAFVRDGYVVLKGRKKEIINRGGETICPNHAEEDLVNLGLPKNTIVHAVENSVLGEDIGISINMSNPEDLEISVITNLLENSKIKYSSLSFGNGIFTATKKPMRTKMSSGLLSINSSVSSYDNLLDFAIFKAKEILSLNKDKISHPMTNFIYNQVKEISSVKQNKDIKHGENYDLNPAYALISLVSDNWSDLVFNKISGEDLIKTKSGLWVRLMNDWPMGDYAKFASLFLTKNNLLSGKVLEVGAGVGNVSRLIYKSVTGHYIRTDLFQGLLDKYPYSDHQETYDFNQPGKWKNLDTIFSVNALHCAVDKKSALNNLFNMLNEGGYLVLAEGSPITNIKSGTPWALNYAFGLFQGWHDVGGFISREAWLEYFKEIGFSAFGALKLRSGRNDLGGIIWGKK